jgi:hypothetical protein
LKTTATTKWVETDRQQHIRAVTALSQHLLFTEIGIVHLLGSNVIIGDHETFEFFLVTFDKVAHVLPHRFVVLAQIAIQLVGNRSEQAVPVRLDFDNHLVTIWSEAKQIAVW